MNIVAIRFHTQHELVARLRKVTMLHDKSIFPYKNADIQVTDIATDQLAPAQLYVLRAEFEKVRDLRWALHGHGLDLLRLGEARIADGQLSEQPGVGQPLGFIDFDLQVGEDTQTITLLPPVVEIQEEANRVRHNLINDGLHRCYLARVSWVIPAVVRIEGVPKDLPYYAFPTPGGWADVHIVDAIGAKLIKKHHRFPYPDYKRYYRDFNSAFTNVGGPRGIETKGGGSVEARPKKERAGA